MEGGDPDYTTGIVVTRALRLLEAIRSHIAASGGVRTLRVQWDLVQPRISQKWRELHDEEDNVHCPL
ncbi:hypothetical protein Q3G72_032285 [Acer saccharum]|nr:hypothetical protein Q3G72_032285 [Acer saccharum]